jgi:murein DD-endopeptidase MepM/ murein hydrolase activator NlpD
MDNQNSVQSIMGGINGSPSVSDTPQGAMSVQDIMNEAVGGQPDTSSDYQVQPGDTLTSIAQNAGVTPDQITGYKSGNPDKIMAGETVSLPGSTSEGLPEIKQPTMTGILGAKGHVTQHYGQQSQYDVFSHKISPAYEIGIPVGTPVAAPPGRWKVIQAFGRARKNGFIGNRDGNGWGNNIRIKNMDTGEVVGYNHLNSLNVKNGEVIQGGVQVAETGKSGNATGPHIAITYKNSKGQVGDFEQTKYANSIYGKE